jgi:uncharacterized protein involved in response to NO
MMQITDLQEAQKTLPIFRLGFRPFFLGGVIFSLIAITLWLLIYKGAVSFIPYGGGYWWHIHEMIFGFGSAIIAGFLLTAVQNWTGLPSVKGKQLAALFFLWLLGRVVMLMPSLLGDSLSAFIDLSFLLAVAYTLAKPILAIKQYRNLFFVPLLVLFTIANGEMHLASIYPQSVSLNYSGYAGVLLVVFLMSVMSGRVVPMFTANGTQTTKATPTPLLDKLANGSLMLAMLMLLLHPLIGFVPMFFGVILIFSGLFQLIRWLRWRPWITLGVPLLWSLHFAIKFIWFGLILLGFSYIIDDIPTHHVWHLLTIGGMGGIVLSMISRVSLGHCGRPLTPPKMMSFAFAFITLSAMARVFGPWLMPERTLLFVDISGFCWLVAFGLFTFYYAPMLLKAREDGRPG